MGGKVGLCHDYMCDHSKRRHARGPKEKLEVKRLKGKIESGGVEMSFRNETRAEAESGRKGGLVKICKVDGKGRGRVEMGVDPWNRAGKENGWRSEGQGKK